MLGLDVLHVFCSFQVAFCVSPVLDQAEYTIFDLYQVPVAFQFCVKINKFSLKLSNQSSIMMNSYLLNKLKGELEK